MTYRAHGELCTQMIYFIEVERTCDAPGKYDRKTLFMIITLNVKC